MPDSMAFQINVVRDGRAGSVRFTDKGGLGDAAGEVASRVRGGFYRRDDIAAERCWLRASGWCPALE
jgi:hypothetical protein